MNGSAGPGSVNQGRRLARIDERVLFLGSQTFLMGMLAGFIVIPASGLFLARYGSENLPWIYGAIAMVALAGTSALARAVRYHHIATIAVPVLLGMAAIIFFAWVELATAGHPWVSAPLLVLFPISYQTGFVLIGCQAGLVFDVGEMKAHFSHVVAGFPLGFIVSGVVGSVVIGSSGRAEFLLLFSSASTLGMLAVIRITKRRFNALLSHQPSLPDTTQPGIASSVKALLRMPLVAGLLMYQLLSQVGTQLVDFLVYDRAAFRYADGDRLSHFVSDFTSVLNAVDLIFLVVVAGFLLRRFGMRVGVVLNPIVVSLFVIAALLSGALTSTASLTTLMLICAARVSDISLTDGATRGSLNTAFQAVGTNDRMAAQAVIEGAGMPLAIGLTGITILVLQRVAHLGFTGMALFTAGVCVGWIFTGQLVFRRYRGALRSSLSDRLLNPGDLSERGHSATPSAPNGDPPEMLETPARTIRALRARARNGQVSTEELIDTTTNWNREVGLRACELLATHADVHDHRLLAVGQAMAQGDREAASKFLHAISLIEEHERHAEGPGSTQLVLLRKSIDDELRLLQQRALAILALTNDRKLVADSARPLRWGNSREQALALETLSLHLPRSELTIATPMLHTSLSTAQRIVQLDAAWSSADHVAARHPPIPAGAPNLDAALSDIIVDRDRVWRSDWLRVCAQVVSRNDALAEP